MLRYKREFKCNSKYLNRIISILIHYDTKIDITKVMISIEKKSFKEYVSKEIQVKFDSIIIINIIK